MFKVKILTIGKAKESWLKEAIAEYEKRLKPKMAIEWRLFEREEALEEECLKEPLLIALDLHGKEISSETLSEKLFGEWGSRFSLVIGGSEGISKKIVEKAAFRWCLSKLTFTHQMTRLIMLEQLYRATEIEKGSGYHK